MPFNHAQPASSDTSSTRNLDVTQQPDPESAEVGRLLTLIEESQMGLPALIFFSSHRPLSLVAGHCLHLLAPLADMSGWTGCARWATLLSDPDKVDALEERLQHGAK